MRIHPESWGSPDLASHRESAPSPETAAISDHPSVEVDIACAGFGPAMGGFLTTLTQAWSENPADPAFESRVMPGMPLQVLCYERADTLSAGVSGVVTSARGIRSSFPQLDPADIPMAAPVREERVFYLLDPIGASRRSPLVRMGDALLRLGSRLWLKDHAFELPWTPAFLHKTGGMVLSIGQFNLWVSEQLTTGGLVQIWPGMPVAAPLFDKDAVAGVRLADQGAGESGAEGFTPGMVVRARLTVVGDGPVGQMGAALNPGENRAKGRDWALGMKFVIELPEDTEDSELRPGSVWHTFGYPEPEIFGFLYVHPGRLVSVGIFVPSWMGDPSRSAYRYLQHYIRHPALWKHLKDGTLRSWGAKSIEESGCRAEPPLSGDGYARIGEGSGSTNMLTGSGVDEAWTTGVQLGEAVLELLREGKPFTHENLAATYETRRRASWVERGAREAENARNGFHSGFLRGLFGMALAGLTRGKLSLHANIPPAHRQIHPLSPFAGIQLKQAAAMAFEDTRALHDVLMSARGWPEIPFDDRLLLTHQDALLMGGKVQAPPGFADHVIFRNKSLCLRCAEKTCIAMCSGQAITLGEEGVPVFEREKCVHCGACLWNCAQSPDGINGNIEFRAGAGGLHSGEN